MRTRMTTTMPDGVDMSPAAIERRLEVVRRLHRVMQRLAEGVLTGPVRGLVVADPGVPG